MKNKPLDPAMLQAVGELLTINRNSFSLFLEFDNWITKHRDMLKDDYPIFDWENQFEDGVLALEKIQFEVLHHMLYDEASASINTCGSLENN